MDKLEYVMGKPSHRAVFKSHVEDFQVEEQLGFEISGEGEHLCLCIKKTGLTTSQLAKNIARIASPKRKAIRVAAYEPPSTISRDFKSANREIEPSHDS